MMRLLLVPSPTAKIIVVSPFSPRPPTVIIHLQIPHFDRERTVSSPNPHISVRTTADAVQVPQLVEGALREVICLAIAYGPTHANSLEISVYNGGKCEVSSLSDEGKVMPDGNVIRKR